MSFFYRIHKKAEELLSERSFHLFKYKGLYCLAARSLLFFTWNGYVGLDKSHKLYGKDYEDVTVDAYGGINYAESYAPNIDPGILPQLWWLGFDCKHDSNGDLSAIEMMADNEQRVSRQGQYRNYRFVIEEIWKLADQLLADQKEKTQ